MSYYQNFLLVTITAVLLQGCASVTQNKVYESQIGAWKTKVEYDSGTWVSLGTMTYSDKKSATYTFQGGRIQLEEVNSQGQWAGYWIEDSWGDIHCSNNRDGSRTWGKIVFQFDETYNNFKGTYDRCGDGKKNGWVGVRI